MARVAAGSDGRDAHPALLHECENFLVHPSARALARAVGVDRIEADLADAALKVELAGRKADDALAEGDDEHVVPGGFGANFVQ